MNVKSYKENNYSSPVIFNFELNQVQALITLIFSLIGIFIIPIFLAGDLFINLPQAIFVVLPAYLEYPEYYAELYVFYLFSGSVTRIVIFSIFLYFSIFTLRRILAPEKKIQKVNEFKSLKNHVSKWFSFRITHGQSFFILSLAIAGIFFIIEQIIGFYGMLFTMLYEELCDIPIGINSYISHPLLLDNIPIILNSIFILFCIYTIITIKIHRKKSDIKKKNSIYGILIFIVSLVIFMFYLIRLFCHLFLFTDLGYVIGIVPVPSNSYQKTDLIKVIVNLVICIVFLIGSHFLKTKNKDYDECNQKGTWFRVKLTKNRVIMLFSYFLISISFLYYFLLSTFFISGIWDFTFESVILISTGIFIYTFYKLNNKNLLTNSIKSISERTEYKTNWFNYNLNHLYSISFFSISSGAIFLYIIQMFLFNFMIRRIIFYPGLYANDVLIIISFFLMIFILGALLIFTIYTIKCTIKSIKKSR